MSERIESLKRRIEQPCFCKARHSVSTPVLERFRAEVVWESVTETFALDGQAMASRCYAFRFVQNDNPEVKSVLGVLGIDSPRKVLKAAIAATARGK